MNNISVDIAGARGRFSYAMQFSGGAGVTVLFGKSGAGKSTAISAISGLIKPQNGMISVGDTVFFDSVKGTSLSPRKRRIGMIFQDSHLFPHFSVRKNLTYARWAGWRRSALNFDDVVSLLGLGELLDRRPTSLSGGERQRVAIGRALLADPRLLIMDEPLANLDNARRAELIPYFKNLSAETEIPILYITHSMDEVLALANDLVLIDKGQISSQGKVRDVIPMINRSIGGDNDSPVSILSGRCVGYDGDGQTSSINIGGMNLKVPGYCGDVGNMARIRIEANEVILSTKEVTGLSIRNTLPAEITRMQEAPNGLVNVHLLVAAQPLLAQITRHATAELGLKRGKKIFALLKSSALKPVS